MIKPRNSKPVVAQRTSMDCEIELADLTKNLTDALAEMGEAISADQRDDDSLGQFEALGLTIARLADLRSNLMMEHRWLKKQNR